MSRRTERVASVVRSILAEAIQVRLSDPRIEPLTSITHVEVSPDLSVARVYVSVLAPETRRKLTLDALRHAAGRLRSSVARGLAVRQTPYLDFRLDGSLQHSFETVQQLDRIVEELGERANGESRDDESRPDAAERSGARQARRDTGPDDLRHGQEDR